ncbi:hypothetical protein IMAU30005_00600 [Lactobacillus helveticus]|nr:hypothetical protein [Lactobacillus helveticus]
MPSQLALCQVIKMKARTYNELIFNSFGHRDNAGGEKDVKLKRIQEKLWCGRSQLSKHNS